VKKAVPAAKEHVPRLIADLTAAAVSNGRPQMDREDQTERTLIALQKVSGRARNQRPRWMMNCCLRGAMQCSKR
jgi:hypothetical protein